MRPVNRICYRRMFAATNAMMLDMLAAWRGRTTRTVAADRPEGIAKVQAEGAFKGRPEDAKRNGGGQISRSTIARIAKRSLGAAPA